MASEDQRTRRASRCVSASRVLAIAALACSLGGCGGSSTSKSTATSTASYKTLVDAGIKLLSQGNTNAAAQLFQQAIAKNPRDPVAHYNLGVVYQGTGDRGNALRQYHEALLADPRYVPAIYNEAILWSPRDDALAIFYYRRVTTLQPDSPTAFLNVGLLESQTKSLHRVALKDLKQAVALDPSLRSRIPAPLRAELAAGSKAHRK